MYQQDFKKFESNVFHETPEGYLTGKLCVTGAGVFRYLNDDRKFVGRLRSVQQVKDATDSLNCKPVTLQHPNQPVSLDNVKNLSVGMSANDATFDGLNNFITVTVTEPNAIKAIKSGEVKAISCGYKCDVVDNIGVWQGSKHEQEQRDIVYNHIALVREGRAGDQVRFCVGDSADAEDYFEISVDDELNASAKTAEKAAAIVDDEHSNNHSLKEKSMKTIHLDGVEYQADEKVIEALQAAQADSEEKLQEIHTLLDGISDLESQVADLQAQVETANDEVDEALIDAAVTAKIAIMDVARAAGIECDASTDVSDLKRQVISSAFDNIDLDSIEEESAINALYSSAASIILAANDETDENDEEEQVNPAAQFDGAVQGHRNTMAVGDSAEDAYARQLFNISNGIKEA